MTPLLIAARNLDLETVKLLLKAGASPNVMDKWNYTPLMYTAVHNEPDVVEALFNTLIQAGCDVNFGATLNLGDENSANVRNTNLLDIYAFFEDIYITYVREPLGVVSGTALHMAVQNPHLPTDVLEILLQAGSEVNTRNLYGQTPLVGAMLDIYYDYHSNMKGHTELLLKHDADVNIADVRGWTPLHYAAQRGSVSRMELLLKAGANTNCCGQKGESPLWLLLVHGWREAARFLLQNGCNIDQAISGRSLVDFNDKINICRHGDILPLEFAICNKFYDVAQLLIKCGCELPDEIWVGDRQAPFDSQHANLLRILAETKAERSRIKSLSSCCKDALRSFLQQGIVVKLESVALPASLRNYVCLR